MSIVSSTRALGPDGIDGRRMVMELHTDSEGVAHKVEYLSAADTTQLDAFMAARAIAIAEKLADREAAALIGEGT